MKRDTFRAHINNETVTSFFFDIAEERYPSAEKLTQMATRVVDPMGVDAWEAVHVKIGLLTIMRDMIKQVSPTRLYRTIQHRDDLFLAVIEALENLEDDLEEIEEKELAEQEKESEKT